MAEIYLPLRSNCAWFANSDTYDNLVRRLKNFVLFYDGLVLQDGRYSASFVETGSSDRMTYPAEDEGRSDIRFFEPGRPFEVRIASNREGPYHRVVGGELEAGFEVDFWPALNEAGITSADYISWVTPELATESQRRSRFAAFRARNDPQIVQSLPVNRFFQSKIIDSFHDDAFIAGELGLPLSVDSNASHLIDQVNRVASMGLSPDPHDVFHQAWLSLGFPDAGSETWDNVLQARESSAGAELRKVMERLGDLAVAALEDQVDQREWLNEAKRLLAQEIAGELLKRRASMEDLAVNFTLNILPLVGSLGTAIDLRKALRERHSWINLLNRI